MRSPRTRRAPEPSAGAGAATGRARRRQYSASTSPGITTPTSPLLSTAQASRGPGEQHPVALGARGRSLAPAQHEGSASPRSRKKVSPMSSVRNWPPMKNPQAAGERQRGENPRSAWREATRRERREGDAQQAGDRGPQPRGPLVEAEQREHGRGRPVLQRRLLEVLDAVQPRRDPVARVAASRAAMSA